MFYGNRIDPGTFYITDESITGSGGKVSITLRDDKRAGLYRADCLTPHAAWATIGNVLYDEGIALVKTPNIPYYGKDQFKVSFQGEHEVNVMSLSILCPKGHVNSSSNPSFKKLKPTDYLSEHNDEFVYITSINLHDDNLNVIARANLAQPVLKRNTDHYLFKVKLDF